MPETIVIPTIKAAFNTRMWDTPLLLEHRPGCGMINRYTPSPMQAEA
jgi:hypothetical protein